MIKVDPKIAFIVVINIGLLKIRLMIKFLYFLVFTPWNEQEMAYRKPETA